MSAQLPDTPLAKDKFQGARVIGQVGSRELVEELKTRDLDQVIDEMVWRYCILAENRSWMQKILDMGREHWLAQPGGLTA